MAFIGDAFRLPPSPQSMSFLTSQKDPKPLFYKGFFVSRFSSSPQRYTWIHTVLEHLMVYEVLFMALPWGVCTNTIPTGAVPKKAIPLTVQKIETVKATDKVSCSDNTITVEEEFFFSIRQALDSRGHSSGYSCCSSIGWGAPSLWERPQYQDQHSNSSNSVNYRLFGKDVSKSLSL